MKTASKSHKLMKQGILSLALILVLAAKPVWADAKSESFIEENISQLLLELERIEKGKGDKSKFEEKVENMVDFPRISRFMLGRYVRGMPKNLYSSYAKVYRDYLKQYYFKNLLSYAGSEIKVNGSIDLKRGDSIVQSKILNQETDKMLVVDWRVSKQKDGSLRVLDIALSINNNQIWLAQEQRSQFMAVLDFSDGDVQVLIKRLQQQLQKP